jgi:hypothetical protein
MVINLYRTYVVEAEREIQKNYWAEHSADLTMEAMMLDSNASDLDKEERPEVYLPLFSLSLSLSLNIYIIDSMHFYLFIYGSACC